MSDQDCCCSKNVLRTADMRATIQGVTKLRKHKASGICRQKSRNCAVC